MAFCQFLEFEALLVVAEMRSILQIVELLALRNSFFGLGKILKPLDGVLIKEVRGYRICSIVKLLLIDYALNEVLKTVINCIWLAKGNMINPKVAILFCSC